MCSISSSFDKEILQELIKSNEYRGTHSHSLMVVCPVNLKILYHHKSLGPINLGCHDIPEGYMIVHQQAPTTASPEVHPANYKNQYLWHNGIIKDNCVTRLRACFGTTITWDTKLLLLNLNAFGKPTDIDGSFSCVWLSEGKFLRIFRNAISPLFLDTQFNISSTPFPDCFQVDENVIFDLDLLNKAFYKTDEFKTFLNPYYFKVVEDGKA